MSTRTIENKEFQIEIRRSRIVKKEGEKNPLLDIISENKKTDYFTQIYEILSMPCRDGWNNTNLDKMKLRLDFMDKLKNAKINDKIQIHELEYTELMAANEIYVFHATDNNVYDFIVYLNQLPKDK